MAYLYALVICSGLFIASTYLIAPPSSAQPPYIAVESLGLEFTEREYHRRVRQQIEDYGFRVVCVEHLLTLSPAAKTYNVNHARQNLVLVTECDRAAP